MVGVLMLLCYWCGREIEDESTVRFQGMVQWMDFCSWSCADAYRENEYEEARL